MKLAVCFYGQPRQIQYWHDNNKKFLKDCQCDYYIHFWGDSAVKKQTINIFNPVRYKIEPQVDIDTNLNFTPNTRHITKSLFATLSPLYSMNALRPLIKDVHDDYDHWILTRPDIVAKGSPLPTLLKGASLYTSYVPGDEWLTSLVDCKFICGTKKDIVDLTYIYPKLNLYCEEQGVPLCHHRLFFHVLKKRLGDALMIKADENHPRGGWYFARENNVLTIS